jgi:cyanate permease
MPRVTSETEADGVAVNGLCDGVAADLRDWELTTHDDYAVRALPADLDVRWFARPRRGRHVKQFTALQFALIGFVGVLFSIAVPSLGWWAVVTGITSAGMLVVSFVALIRNHRDGRTL